MRTASGDGCAAPLVDVANAQHGVVTHAQLSARLTRNGIARRCDRGELHRLYPGVFAVGHTALSREGRWLAAVFAAGEGAVLCRKSCAGAARDRALAAARAAGARAAAPPAAPRRRALRDAQPRSSRHHSGQRHPVHHGAAAVRGPQRRAHPGGAHALHPRGGASRRARPEGGAADHGARERAPQPGSARDRDRGLARRQRRQRAAAARSRSGARSRRPGSPARTRTASCSASRWTSTGRNSSS